MCTSIVYSFTFFVALFSVTYGFHIATSKPMKEKIIGGEYVNISALPSFAVVYRNGEAICGASIISNHWLLSAAHCFEGFEYYKYHVYMGRSYLIPGYGSEYDVEEVKIHPGFDHHLRNDIALIKLKLPIVLIKNNVELIQLASKNPEENDEVFIIGFGYYDKNYRIGAVGLRGANLKVSNHDSCVQDYKKSRFSLSVSPYVFCAKNPGTDTCKGDSGGPAIINNQLAGIVSHGIGCAKQSPGVYTNVFRYRIWIRETMYDSS